jgi:hypothetical protein
LNLEEGNGDPENDSLPNFIEDVSNMVVDVNVANNSSNITSSGKTKAT